MFSFFRQKNRGLKWRQEIQDADEFLDDARATDLVIVVMGATGAGKSTFINRLLDTEVAPVGHGLESCTEHVKAYHLPDAEFPDNRIILVDTPGFDDSKVLESEIVRRISIWLARSYTANMKIAGVIYCHNILEAKWSSAVQASFHLFQKLCGPAAARKTVILTTRWDVPKDVQPLMAREEQLKNTYWKRMMAAGTMVYRSTPTREGARDIIDSLLIKNAHYDPLQIQTELVDSNMSLSSTQVGQKLFDELLNSLKVHQEIGRILRDREGNREENSQIEAEISRLVAELKQQSVSTPRKLALLMNSFSWRVYIFCYLIAALSEIFQNGWRSNIRSGFLLHDSETDRGALCWG